MRKTLVLGCINALTAKLFDWIKMTPQDFIAFMGEHSESSYVTFLVTAILINLQFDKF
jgi:O-glycosyl hydrolase